MCAPEVPQYRDAAEGHWVDGDLGLKGDEYIRQPVFRGHVRTCGIKRKRRSRHRSTSSAPRLILLESPKIHTVRSFEET